MSAAIDPATGEHPLAARIAAILDVDPSAAAIEFEQQWSTWGQIGAVAEALRAVIAKPGTQVGLVLRNRPESVALLIGVLRCGGCAVVINPGRGVDATRREIADLGLDVVAGSSADLDQMLPPDWVGVAVCLDGLGQPLQISPSAAMNEPSAPTYPDVAVRMITSGTTGPPKRVDLRYRVLQEVLVGARHYEADRDRAAQLRSGIAIVNAPLVHVAGLFRVVQCVVDGRSFALLERFAVDTWLDAVRRHRPATTSLVPAALRMVIDADLDPRELSSLRSVISGTAPLDPHDADAFTAKYGIPVLISYGATEFGGGVAGWNLRDHQQFWDTKRGSVGRAHAGCQLRVVDPNTDAVLPTGEPGVLEVLAAQLGSSTWVRTTDLARLDDDGFLFILGRTDQTIIRGGFKIQPESVRTVLERHPAVVGAAVVGVSDRRLGSVPVAAVELREPATVTAEDLLAYASRGLAGYEVPVELRIVATLARTPSGKPDLGAIAEMFADRAADSNG